MQNLTFSIEQKTFHTHELLPYFKGNELIDLCQSGCPNFGKIWSCPPYTIPFDKLAKQFNSITLFMVKASHINKDINYRVNTNDAYQAMNAFAENELEKKFDGQFYLANHPCKICESCTAPEAPCRFPDKMHYDLTGTGLHVVNIMKDFFNHTIAWPEKDKAPVELSGICAHLFNRNH